MTEPAAQTKSESEDWRNGRLVVRRPEVPDSDITGMTVVTTREEHLALDAVVYALVDRIRAEDAAEVRGYAIPQPEVIKDRDSRPSGEAGSN
jgi:hypothetical protein